MNVDGLHDGFVANFVCKSEFIDSFANHFDTSKLLLYPPSEKCNTRTDIKAKLIEIGYVFPHVGRRAGAEKKNRAGLYFRGVIRPTENIIFFPGAIAPKID